MFETIAVLMIIVVALFLIVHSLYKSIGTKEGCHGNCGNCKFPDRNHNQIKESNHK